MSDDSAKQVVLITGANKGIGLETARQLHAHYRTREGVTLLIGARDAQRGEAAADELRAGGAEAIFVRLDVEDQASIAQAAEQVQRRFGRLDTLINNAGWLDYAREGVASTADIATMRKTFDINFFGLVATTQAMLPLLKRNSEIGRVSRVVNLTSILGSIAEHADVNSSIYEAKFLGYDCSKAAVNMFTNHLAHELRPLGIKVNAAHPGWVKTDMGGPNATLELVDGAKTSVQLATLGADGPTGGYYHMGVHMRW
jgi:NAD(P)-dependent dehydrogenase (short-subunit alcohol dehydrogenase family)